MMSDVHVSVSTGQNIDYDLCKFSEHFYQALPCK